MKEAHLFIKADGGFIVEVRLRRVHVSIGFGRAEPGAPS